MYLITISLQVFGMLFLLKPQACIIIFGQDQSSIQMSRERSIVEDIESRRWRFTLLIPRGRDPAHRGRRQIELLHLLGLLISQSVNCPLVGLVGVALFFSCLPVLERGGRFLDTFTFSSVGL